MSVFTWIPDWAPSAAHDIRVLSTPFGDGYVQDIGDGINTDLPPWNVSFSNRSASEYDAILAFFDALAPGQRFTWTPPRRSAGTFKCLKFQETPYTNGSTAHAITAVFQRVVA
jgi:phage-related protein